MTQTASLSARIILLEHTAKRGQTAQEEVQRLAAQMQDLQADLNAEQNMVVEGQRAQRILDHLAEQTDRVLAGGELIEAAAVQADLPEPHEQPQLGGFSATQPDLGGLQNSPQADQEENPTDTTETLEPPQGNLVGNSGDLPQDSAPFISDQDRIRAWVQELEESRIVTARSISAEFNIPEKSVGKYLSNLMFEGLLYRVPGTGLPGKPSEYRPGQPSHAAAQEPTQEAQPEHQAELRTDHLPRDLPPVEQKAQEATSEQCNMVFNALHEHGRVMSQTMLINRLAGRGIKLSVLLSALAQLEAQGRARKTPDRLYEVTPIEGAKAV